MPKRRRPAHRIPFAAANMAMCIYCTSWFDRRKGAEESGRQWFKVCEDCRASRKLAKKKCAERIPEGVLIRTLMRELEEGRPQRARQARQTDLREELAHLQQRKLVRPVEGRSLTRRQMRRAWRELNQDD